MPPWLTRHSDGWRVAVDGRASSTTLLPGGAARRRLTKSAFSCQVSCRTRTSSFDEARMSQPAAAFFSIEQTFTLPMDNPWDVDISPDADGVQPFIGTSINFRSAACDTTLLWSLLTLCWCLVRSRDLVVPHDKVVILAPARRPLVRLLHPHSVRCDDMPSWPILADVTRSMAPGWRSENSWSRVYTCVTACLSQSFTGMMP